MDSKYLFLVIVILVFLVGFWLCKDDNLFLFEKDECEHKNTFTSVKNVTVTCETTITECMDCGKQLTKPKIDCR